MREWIFERFEEGGKLFLTHESGGFGWTIRTEDIDWGACTRARGIEK